MRNDLEKAYQVNPLVVVMAHTEAQPTYTRHLPIWSAHRLPILTYFPQNSTFPCPNSVSWGNKGHNGGDSIRRFHWLFTHLAGLSHSHFIVHEYDSLSLRADLPVRYFGEDAFWSTVCHNREPLGNGNFESPIYFHSPMIFSKSVVERMVAAFAEFPPDSERGFWDRYLGLMFTRKGWQYSDYGTEGYSRNTIEECHLIQACDAARRGAFQYHGIKNERTLSALLTAYHYSHE